MQLGAQQILHFWFTKLSPKDWYVKNPELDRQISQQYGGIHQQACHGELYPWRQSAEGRVAEIIILDQFSRNMFRDDPRSFAYDGMALVLAQEAVSHGALSEVKAEYQHHILLPYMHSESLLIHQQAVEQRTLWKLDLDYELRHKKIIERFGRYPHRNEVLGRPSTAEEIAFLKEPGSSF